MNNSRCVSNSLKLSRSKLARLRKQARKALDKVDACITAASNPNSAVLAVDKAKCAKRIRRSADRNVKFAKLFHKQVFTVARLSKHKVGNLPPSERHEIARLDVANESTASSPQLTELLQYSTLIRDVKDEVKELRYKAAAKLQLANELDPKTVVNRK